MKKLNQVSIVSLLFLPYFFALLLVLCPFGLSVRNTSATITDYSGNRSIVHIPSRLFFWKITELGNKAFANNERLKTVFLPSTIRRIGESSFEGCSNLEGISMPDSINSIGNLAFAECNKLEYVSFSDNLTYIGYFAFANCKQLQRVTPLSDKAFVGTGAFLNTNWLYGHNTDYVIIGDHHYIYLGNKTNIVVPDHIKTVDFYDNEKVRSVKLPNAFNNFIDYCFQGCESLKSITPLKGHWGAYCFGGCYNLTGINWTGKYIRPNTNIYYAEYNRPFAVDNAFKAQQRSATS